MDIQNDRVYIKVEISKPGCRHADCYATSAMDEDPASRLAFRVRYVTSAGKEDVFYAKNDKVTNVFRANSFVDILVDQKSDLDIAETPRRYLYSTRPTKYLHEKLVKFVRGNYTTLPSKSILAPM